MIPPNLNEEDLERWRIVVQNRLNAITVDRKKEVSGS